MNILIITPETLKLPQVLCCLESCNVERIILDEAHCLDQWGHQFRPVYLELGTIRNNFKCQCVAFTATASVKSCEVICESLQLNNPFSVKQSFSRANLCLHVKEKSSFKQACTDLINLLNTAYDKESVIIYCLSPSECDKVFAYCCDNSIRCVCYHGGISAFTKSDNLQKWLRGDVYVIIASKSLGMGIDKSNVRAVFHFSFPSTIPEYYQQVGRAGRDGGRSDCFLYFNFSDRAIHLDHIGAIKNTKCSRNAFVELKGMVELCFPSKCIKSRILSYFGEEHFFYNCQMCSVCLKAAPIRELDITVQTRHVLLVLQGLITKLEGKVSFNLLAKVLSGSKEKDILNKDLQFLPLYGCCKALTLNVTMKMLAFLWVKNVLTEEKKCICPGSSSDNVHDQNFKLQLTTL